MSDWLQRARAAAQTDPSSPRLALFFRSDDADRRIGSLEPKLGERMVAARLPLRATAAGYRVDGTADESLALLAEWLRAEAVLSHWRGELLSVVDAGGIAVGAIERAAVRPLGIKTWAVHLVGLADAGRVWVQQRAFDKATDPGRWDTLMGGQVAAGESIETTLARETDEEAGLALVDLRQLARVEPVAIRRPIDDGYMVEDIAVFRAVVAAGSEPVNRDGEVERFECLGEDELVARLASGAFTLEATLILGAELERRRQA